MSAKNFGRGHRTLGRVRSIGACGVVALTSLTLQYAHGQAPARSYLQKSIRIIVPLAASGPTDLIGREPVGSVPAKFVVNDAQFMRDLARKIAAMKK